MPACPQLSKEFVQDLSMVAEENQLLLRETLQVGQAHGCVHGG